MTDARDIAANAVSKPGKVPTIFHVVPESHYDFISTEYKQQPEREAYKIKKLLSNKLFILIQTVAKKLPLRKLKKLRLLQLSSYPSKPVLYVAILSPKNGQLRNF